jgi:hypothetical protein
MCDYASVRDAFGLRPAPYRLEACGEPLADVWYPGPAPVDELTVTDEADGAGVYFEGKRVLSVNRLGGQLLRMADGSATLNDIIKRTHTEKIASDVAMFFVFLSENGYLKNRVEVKLYTVSHLYSAPNFGADS